MTRQSAISWHRGTGAPKDVRARSPRGWGQREEMEVAKRGHSRFRLPDAVRNAIDPAGYPVAPSDH